jgi:quercetin dioxygenase-like cupin family protein
MATESYMKQLWDMRDKIINMSDRALILPSGDIQLSLTDGNLLGKVIYHKDDVLINYWEAKKGTEHPIHKHKGVEIIFLIVGKMVVTYCDAGVNSKVINASQSLHLTENLEHSSIFLEDCKLITITYPAEKGYENA